MTRDIRDRTQHQRRGHRQLERQGREPEKAADAAADSGQYRRRPLRRRALRSRLDRADGDVEPPEDRGFDDLVEAIAGCLRHQPHHPRNRPAGIVGKPGGEIRIFQVLDGASQRLLLGRRKGDRWLGLDH